MRNELNAAAIEGSEGRGLLVQYADPAAPTIAGVSPSSTQLTNLKPGMYVVMNEDRVNLRGGSSMNAKNVEELPGGTALTIQEGPMNRGCYTGWKVETAEKIVGWISDSFIAPPPHGAH